MSFLLLIYFWWLVSKYFPLSSQQQ